MKLLKEEQGIALIVAMSVLAIILILGITIFVSAQSALNLTVFDRSSNSAFHAAEAGFNQAVYLARSNSLNEGTTTVSLENVEYRLIVTKKGTGIYNVVSIGAVPSFAQEKAKRAIAATIQAFNPWDTFYVSLSGGEKIEGNAFIEGPFYTTDLFSLNGTGQTIKYTKGPLYIKDNPSTPNYTGDLELKGNAQAGEASEPITLFMEGRFLPNTTVGVNLFYNEMYTEVPVLDFPMITLDVLRNEYKPKATLIWNGNLYFDDSLGGQNPPTYPQAVLSTTGFKFYWKDKQKTEGLLVFDSSPTVYVNGNLRFGNNNGKTTTIYYYGKVNFIAEGDVSFSGPVVPALSSSSFSPNYASFPLINTLGITTPYKIELEFTGTGSGISTVYAVLYSNDKIEYEKQVNFFGTSLSKYIELENNPSLHYVENISQNLPPNMPKPKTTVSILGWKEITPP